VSSLVLPMRWAGSRWAWANWSAPASGGDDDGWRLPLGTAARRGWLSLSGRTWASAPAGSCSGLP
jgi:hypothetical protein